MGTKVLIQKSMVASRPMFSSAEVSAFIRRAFGIRFEMRYHWEAQWWPVDAQDVGETLASYYDNLHSCLEQLREGRELRSDLASFRMLK